MDSTLWISERNGVTTNEGDDDRAVVAYLAAERGAELRGFAKHLGATPEQAEDAVQEGLLRLWVALADGVAIERPDAWLFRTLYRICMDQHRWRRRARELADRIGRRPPVEVHDTVDRLAVWAAAERLPPRQRAVVFLRYQADMTFEQIGSVLGIAPISARSYASRGVDAIQKRLRVGEEND
jgi:RNA polymerase sigma factor (sigma-70 family)